MAEKKNSKRARKPLTKKYIVVFQDENNEVLKTTFVPEGGTAQPPDVPRKRERRRTMRSFLPAGIRILRRFMRIWW